MGTIHCTLQELQQGLSVPLDERTTIVVTPNAMLATVRGRAFDTGKTFVLPRALVAFQDAFEFALSAQSAKAALIVAHTDETEADADELSAERAKIASAWLLGEVDPWLDNFEDSIDEAKRWGSREDRLLLGAIKGFEPLPAGHSVLTPAQRADGEARDEVVAQYQKARALSVDGIAGPVTRRQLITDYFAQSRSASLAEPASDGGEPPAAAPSGPGTLLQLDVSTHGAASHFSIADAEAARQAAAEEAAAGEEKAAASGEAPPGEGSDAAPTTATAVAAPSDTDDAAPFNGRLDFFFFFARAGIEPAPTGPGGQEYLEWIRLATRHKEFSVGSARGGATQLALRLFDKTGLHRHANQRYEISGPESFEGTTDSSGGIDHDDVLPGDYTLTLKLSFFEGEQEITDVHTSPFVVQPGTSEPQVRMLGVVPRCTLARLRGMLFDTNKAFLLPSALDSLKKMRSLYEQHSPGELLVVGHTDTTGTASINDPLSLERAKSTLAYLEDDVDTWLSFYAASVSESRRWGALEDQHMMVAVLAERGVVTKSNLIRDFQQSSGIEPANGTMDIATRTQLIQDYMGIDGAELDAAEFTLSGTAHGCGENFPVDESGDELDRAPADDQEDALDRRVELFFFDPDFGIVPPPPGENSKPGSTEYPTWRRQAELTEDLELKKDVAFLTVTDAEGRPQQGVVVEAIAAETVLSKERTGADGKCALRMASRAGAQLRISEIDEALLPERAPEGVATFTADELSTGVPFPEGEDVQVRIGLFELVFRLEEGLLPETGNQATLKSADGAVDETAELVDVGDEGFEKEVAFVGVPCLGKAFTVEVTSGDETRTVFEGLTVSDLLAEIAAANADLVLAEPIEDKRLARLEEIEAGQEGGPSGEVVV